MTQDRPPVSGEPRTIEAFRLEMMAEKFLAAIAEARGFNDGAEASTGAALDWSLVIDAVANTMLDGDTFALPHVIAAEYTRLAEQEGEGRG